MTQHFIGVDVGTGSARAGVFDAAGTMLASAKTDIRVWREAGDIVEQSSNDIWRAVCSSVREAVAAAGVSPRLVAGLGFDATCSLVVLGEGGQSLAVGPSGDPERNIIVVMIIAPPTSPAHQHERWPHCAYVGGTISPEMETPCCSGLLNICPPLCLGPAVLLI